MSAVDLNFLGRDGMPIRRHVFTDDKGAFGLVVQANSEGSNLEAVAWVTADRRPIAKDRVPEEVQRLITDRALASRLRILAEAEQERAQVRAQGPRGERPAPFQQPRYAFTAREY